MLGSGIAVLLCQSLPEFGKAPDVWAFDSCMHAAGAKQPWGILQQGNSSLEVRSGPAFAVDKSCLGRAAVAK